MAGEELVQRGHDACTEFGGPHSLDRLVLRQRLLGEGSCWSQVGVAVTSVCLIHRKIDTRLLYLNPLFCYVLNI